MDNQTKAIDTPFGRRDAYGALSMPVYHTAAYEFDTAAARRDLGQRYKVFAAYDIPWLDYVVDCRAGGNLQNQYDVVEGGVANDNVIDTVEDYENGRITAEQALGQLAYKKVNHQICIRAQKVIDMYLRHVESVELKGA